MAFNKAKAMQEAEGYVSAGKIPQAIKEYRRILDKDPSDLTLLNTIGDLYYRQKNIPEALRHFRKLADAYVQEMFTVKAIAIYKKIIKLEPSSVEPLLKIAELYVAQGLSREARDHYAQAVDFYKKKKLPDKAIEVFRRIVALDLENATYRVRFGEFCSQLGRKDEATEAYLAAAEVALRHEDSKTAESAIRKASQLDPKSQRLHLLRARLALSQGNMGEVEKVLDSVPGLKSSPQGRELLLNAYMAAGRVELAEELVLKVYHSNPEDFSPLASYSLKCLERGDRDAALKPLERVADSLVQQKATAPLMDALRQIWARSPEHIATLELMQRICERTADESTLPEVLEGLGEAYAQAEQLEEAEAVYRKLVGRQPENEHYKSLLNQVLRRLGRAEAAPIPAGVSIGESPLAPEFAPSPVAPPSEEDAQEVATVKEALENSDLFSRYGLVDKAIVELEKALETYPHQVDIHKRILEICHRSQPDRARQAAESLAVAYTERGDAANAKRYEDLARKLAGGAPVEEIVLPEEVPAEEMIEAAEFAAEVPGAPEPAPAEVDLSAVFPTRPPEQPSVEEPPAAPPILEPPPVAAKEFDLSADLEAFAVGAEAPVAGPEAPPFDYEESRVEIDFYLEQELFEEARKAVEALEQRYPGNPQLAELRQRVEARTTQAAGFPTAPEGIAEPVEAAGAEWELPTRFAEPPAARAEPEVSPEAELPPPAPPQEAEMAVAEAPGAGANLLQSLAGELAASMEGLEEPAPAPGVAEGAEPQPAAVGAEGGDAASPLGGLLEELAEEPGAEAAREDPETHYNLGVAFREMGLLDEAIGEFQKVVKGAHKDNYPPNYLQACTFLAVSFMDKGMPAIAAKWYKRALEAPGLDDEAMLALQYDLGVAYEQAGDTRTALERFSEVYSQNIDYRDVAEKIRQLPKKAP